MYRHFAFLTCLLCASLGATEWQDSLWLGRGDIWRARLPVTITNPSDLALEGVPVALIVGNAAGQAPLVGIRAETLRVTDEKGTQLLYGLWGPAQDELVTTGAISDGATLILPAVCGPKTATTYYVYFDNPHAWGLSDFFDKRAVFDLNGDFEEGLKDLPFGWQTAQDTANHRLIWSSEKPFSGLRCLKAETTSDADKSWFSFTRSDLAVVPGAHCTIRVRVRGENLKGDAGWYVHVGDDKNAQRLNKVVRTGEGSFDWKMQVITFTVPEAATRMQTGTVLYGTGTAWYDAFSFETDKAPPLVTANAGSIERLILNEVGTHAAWLTSASPAQSNWFRRIFSEGKPRLEWLFRMPVHVTNVRSENIFDLLAVADLNTAARAAPTFILTLNGEPVDACRFGDRLLFSCSVAARTTMTYYLYVGNSRKNGTPVKPSASVLGSDIPSDQMLAECLSDTDVQAFSKLLASPVNLIKNANFENGKGVPDVWTHSDTNSGVAFMFGTPGGFGKRYARLTVPATAKDEWRGWYQAVSVKPGHTYLYGAWLACDCLEGSASLHAHLRTDKGGIATGGFLDAGEPISDTKKWTPMFGEVALPPDATKFQMHLTMNGFGTLKHDGAFLAECLNATTGDPDTPPLPVREFKVWSVDPVVKVFHETLPTQGPGGSFVLSLARNEEEALQIAVRSEHDIPNVKVEIDKPKNKRGQLISDFTVGWVGYVPIDHRTAYYNLKIPAWELKYPTSAGSSDGWSGWWPDPIRPTASGALVANQTQAIWLSFKTAVDTPAGSYKGQIRFLADGKLLDAVPFTLTVWDFALPQSPTCAAIYELRLNKHWLADGTSAAAQRERLMRFMASKKICPEEVIVAPKFTRVARGKFTCDFSEYDKAATVYFDELKFHTSYMPKLFYLFGWEHPPKNFFNEEPFEDKYPNKDADRTQLRKEYKDDYQACLRLFWEHVKAKGWADKLTLYISDEPFLTKKHIVNQMKACCDMIHEVDPQIRIYSSTWRHCPDWNGYLDVWGVGHYGCFPVSEMQARVAAGDTIWFTTDGQMCTDTPFCAVERLLPHYCFKYGASAYEFWGVSWLTYDPWRFGWHSYIHQSSTPGESYYVRYPNGDGFLLYPGAPIGVQGPVTTIRLEAARDGVEDYEYLHLLKARVNDPKAAQLLTDFGALIDIPNAGGRYSSRILPEPMKLAALRIRAGELLSKTTK